MKSSTDQADTAGNKFAVAEDIGFVPLVDHWNDLRGGELYIHRLDSGWWMVDGLGIFPCVDDALHWVAEQIGGLEAGGYFKGLKVDIETIYD